jgi:hypothetical protein
MKLPLLAALAALSLGCAAEAAATPQPAHPGSPAHADAPGNPAADTSRPHLPPPPAVAPLPTTALTGPYATTAVTCDTAVGLAGAPGPGAPCTAKPLALGAGAPFAAALLRAEDKTDPRFAGSGVFFLAVGNDGAWFVVPRPLDQLNGAAGHTYLPVLSLTEATVAAGRMLFLLRDGTTSVCNGCAGPDHDKHTPVSTRSLVVACVRNGKGLPACSAPLLADEKAKVTFAADGTITIAAPGAPPKTYLPLP